MPAEFEQGFLVRQPAWHGLGTVLPDFLPLGTEEEIQHAMKLAGHNFTISPRPIYAEGNAVIEGWQRLEKVMQGDQSDGAILHVAKDSYTAVDNRYCWDLMAKIVGQGMKLETAITLRGGAVCSLLAWLNEPVRILNDDSDTLPYFNLSWAHDGSGGINGRPTEVR